VIFMGTGQIARASLDRLIHHAGIDVVAVITQPDRPKGRRLHLAASPVKTFAEEKGVRVLAPEKVGADASVQDIEHLRPDLIVVAEYAQYIKPAILKIPPLEAINVHPSLLPRYRGAAPIQMAIAQGEALTGVSIIYVSKEMDAGDVIIQRTVPIGDEDTTETLAPRLADVGAALLVEAVELLREGTAPRLSQDPDLATYVAKLTKEDGRIDWSLPARVIRNRVRGFTPWPGSHCEAPGGRGLKVHRVRIEPGAGEPGTVLEGGKEGPKVATGEDALRLLDVQPEGKARMSGGAYLSGYRIGVGDRLG